MEISRLGDALSSAFNQFCDNGMKVNAEKTQVVVIGTQAILCDLLPALHLCGNVVTDSLVLNSLGVIVHRHLTYLAHIDFLPKKCTDILMALNFALHLIPTSALK